MENKNKMESYLLMELMSKTTSLLYGYNSGKDLSPEIEECAEDLLENILITLTNRLADTEEIEEKVSCGCGNVLTANNGSNMERNIALSLRN